MYAGSRFRGFPDNGDDHHNSTYLSHWTGSASWPVAYIASIDVQRVDGPHDRRDNHLANDESQLSASDVEVSLFHWAFLY